MCQSLKVIVQQNEGYLLHCRDCQHFHLGFGNLGLTLTEGELRGFTQELEKKIHAWEGRVHPSEKSFTFQTDSAKVKMLLCHREMVQWQQLLAKGLLILQAERIMQSGSS